ncbi:MAG TPA: hypothetical protein VFA48_08915 [Gammaproteobacteria bacterium]|nr:hypothetical protein [Gammaproteobacteria bacterium]
MARKKGPTGVDEVEQVMDAWWTRHVQNSPVSRNTEAFNHLQSIFGTLKADVKAIVSPAPAAADEEVNDNAA